MAITLGETSGQSGQLPRFDVNMKNHLVIRTICYYLRICTSNAKIILGVHPSRSEFSKVTCSVMLCADPCNTDPCHHFMSIF